MKFSANPAKLTVTIVLRNKSQSLTLLQRDRRHLSMVYITLSLSSQSGSQIAAVSFLLLVPSHAQGPNSATPPSLFWLLTLFFQGSAWLLIAASPHPCAFNDIIPWFITICAACVSPSGLKPLQDQKSLFRILSSLA